MIDKKRLDEEKHHLKLVKSIILREQQYQLEHARTIPKDYRKRYSDTAGGDEDLIKRMLAVVAERLKKLENLSGNPYHGKINYVDIGDNKLVTLYIGMTTLIDETSHETATIDWRNPVCSLYYEKSLGKTSYFSPVGEIPVDLKLKSQIIIKNGDLIDVVDADAVTEDELLRPYLNNSIDNKLKNIIASIHSSQYTIIKKPAASNIIVQGTAGSGKTIVALDQVGFSVFNESKRYRPDQFMIIGPSRFFIDYISSILPAMEAENIEQCTFEEIFNNLITSKFEIIGQSASLLHYLKSNKIKRGYDYKLSMDCKKDIDDFFDNYIDSLHGDIELYGVVLITERDMKSAIKNGNGPYSERVKKYINDSINRIKNRRDGIYDSIWAKYRVEYALSDKSSSRAKEILNISSDASEILKSGCSKMLKSYFNCFNIDTISLYKKFILELNRYVDDEEAADVLKKDTLGLLSKKKLSFEDLPAIMYINLLLNGCNRFEKFAHVTIDETQDFGLFHLYVLKRIFKNSAFSIFGDLAQSIHPYGAVNDWSLVKNTIFDSNCEIIQLDKSYRNTIEIMDSANMLLQHLNINAAQPVIRHGSDVKFTDVDLNSKSSYIAGRLTIFAERGYKSVALICKTDEEAIALHKSLQHADFKITNVSQKDEKYNGGICVLTSYLAKGLEFDAVIINDASEDVYSSASEIDMHLLYVAMTRPLHELELIYHNNITKPLETKTVKSDFVKEKRLVQ